MTERAETAGTRRKLLCAACALLAAALALPFVAAAQEEAPPAATVNADAPQQQAAPAAASTARITVRGVVRNSQSGSGLPRALVRIEGDAATGVLTDGNGNFEIAGVPTGPQSFVVEKPGYLSRLPGGSAEPALDSFSGSETFRTSSNHNVVVAGEMPDLVFSMAPAAALHGQVQTADGEPLAGIQVQLVWQTVLDGRAVWQAHGDTRTRFDGSFRFGGLPEGTYAVFTNPQLEDVDNETDASDAAADGEAASLPDHAPGYPAVYYPDAREPAAAGKLTLATGQDAQITLTVQEETFHRVIAPVAEDAAKFIGVLQDTQGRSLPYSARPNWKNHSLEALLPDGNYQLQVTSFPTPPIPGVRRGRDNSPDAGMVEFSVAGKPLKTPRIVMGPQRPAQVAVSMLRGDGAAEGSARNSQLVILANPASGWVNDGAASAFASGPVGGPLETAFTAPGSYWLHAQVVQKGLCEGPFTAGGVSVAQEPVRVGPGGSTAPLTLAVRRDCAQLTLHLPAAVMAFSAGEEPYYTAWVVPDFDFTHNLIETTLRPTSGDSITIDGLTPGAYHVYVFAGPHPLEYHNREALTALKNQAITLEPGTTADLTVEVPEP